MRSISLSLRLVKIWCFGFISVDMKSVKYKYTEIFYMHVKSKSTNFYFNYYRFKNWKHMAQIVEVSNAHSRIKGRRDQLTTVIVRHYDNTFCCINSINFTKQNKTVFLSLYHEKYFFTVYCKIQSSFNINQDVKKKNHRALNAISC